jgi:hypothetical protein
MPSDENILKRQLATLLSFDLEDVEDVFEPLLDFDSEEDLLEYMSALLGDDSHEVVEFVNNIMRFQRGDSIIPPALDDLIPTITKSDHKMSARASPERARTSRPPEIAKSIDDEKTRREQQLKEQEQRERDEENRKRKLKEDEDKRRRLEKMRQAEEQKLLEFKRKHESEKRKALDLAAAAATMKVGDNKRNVRVPSEPECPKPSTSRPPQKGKAKVVCGCFGTVHKPLTNCLHCGRIICVREGYGYCPFCSNLVEKILVKAQNGEDFDKAILHKERLLKFDRENTKRTQIFDDQADYFQNSTSTWLSEDEQHDAKNKEEKRRIDLHTIKKHTLNIQF